MVAELGSTTCIENKYQCVNILMYVYTYVRDFNTSNRFRYSFEEINYVHRAISLQEGIVEVLID